MKLLCQSLCFVPLFLFLSCKHNYYKSHNAYAIPTVNNNVCKKLQGRVLLYAIFVDSRQTRPWTSYDISSTLDSIRKATTWIEEKAKSHEIPLTIDVAYPVIKGVIPVEQHLFGESLWKMLFSTNGMDNVDLWANLAAKKAGQAFVPDTSGVVKTKNEITNRERLIARLRDQYKTDNVVVMYFLNNYYTEEISLAMFTGGGKITEFGIISFKNPGVIAHEFLHLFGALDLYISPFNKKKKAVKNRAAIIKAYPDEVMAFAYRPIDKLDVSPLSQYLVGWKDSLAEKDRHLLVGKKIKVYRY